MSTEKDQSKGSTYLEQELANFLGKGLENKYLFAGQKGEIKDFMYFIRVQI